MIQNYFILSKKESELMELMWDAKRPLARQEIIDLAARREDTTWKPNSVHILVNSLLQKGALQVAGFYLDSRKLGRTYEPALFKEDYLLLQIEHAVVLAEGAGIARKKILGVLNSLSVQTAGR